MMINEIEIFIGIYNFLHYFGGGVKIWRKIWWWRKNVAENLAVT